MPCHVVTDAADAAIGDSSSSDVCSACAAFCHGGVVAGIPSALPLAPGHFAPITATITFPSGFISAGLERPPRRAAQ